MEKDVEQLLNSAKVLTEALPYIRKLNRKIIVVKYGGSVMCNEALQMSVIRDVILLKHAGFLPVIVHGGGKEISRWVAKMGGTPRFVNGLRVTDAETMELVEMVLGRINKGLVTMVQQQGADAVGLSGKDGGLLQAEKKYSDGQDIGFVGEVTAVKPQILYDLLEKGYIPVISSVGLDEQFRTYNINADDAAYAVARAVKAEKLMFLTDVEGLYRDINDKSSVVYRLEASQADKMIQGGFIGGGMLPKLSSCTHAVRNGVRSVHILDGRIEHSLLLEIFTSRGIGTVILPDGEVRENE